MLLVFVIIKLIRAEDHRAIIPTASKRLHQRHQPDSFKAKGFNERTFILKYSKGTPEYDISEIVTSGGDEGFELLLNELVDMRKLLLVYRLEHYGDPIPNVKGLNLKGRNSQLCKPLIRLFQHASTNTREEIKASLTRLVREKNERKANTIEAKLYGVVTSFADEPPKKEEQTPLDKDAIILVIKDIRDKFSQEVGGTQSSKNSRSIETSEYGLVSHADIGSILRDRFGGEDTRDKNERKLRFSRAKLEKLKMNYSIIDKITITDTKEWSMGDMGDVGDVPAGSGTHSETPGTTENTNNCNTARENIQEKGKDVGDIIDQRTTKQSEHSTPTSPPCSLRSGY